MERKKERTDVWQLTGYVMEKKRGKKVMYQTIKDHLKAKYGTNLGYGRAQPRKN